MRTNDIALMNTVCLCDTASLTRRHPQMDTYEQHTVTRLRNLLHLVFSSRSLPSELYSWCQIVFPGCCYLRYLGLHELSSWTPFVESQLVCFALSALASDDGFCCSCATLFAENSFATTSNLAARGSLQVLLQSAQQGPAGHGAVLHNSW